MGVKNYKRENRMNCRGWVDWGGWGRWDCGSVVGLDVSCVRMTVLWFGEGLWRFGECGGSFGGGDKCSKNLEEEEEESSWGRGGGFK